MSSHKILFAVVAVVAATTARGDEADRVKSLPEVGPLTSKHYSGYLRIDGSDDSNRLSTFENASKKKFNIHYYYVESLNKPETDPVTLWLNGGPGCSSMIGQWTENGPYMFTQFGKLVNDTYTWAQKTNMLFIESPIGVGFSYATPGAMPGLEGLHIDDDLTSMLNYQALRHFFIKFPQLQGRRLLLTGESYAGHYIPTLADRVLTYAVHSPATDVEKKMGEGMSGFYVGNPCTGAPAHDPMGDPDADYCWYNFTDDWTVQEFYKSHAYGVQYGKPGMTFNPNGEKGTPGMDVYDILAPVCDLSEPALAKAVETHTPHLTVDDIKRRSQYITHPAQTVETVSGAINPYGPCAGNYMTVYLNRKDVQEAMNVAEGSIDWSECSNELFNAAYHMPKTAKGNVAGTMHYYRKFFADPVVKAKWNIVMYSGDTDSRVNFIQSQNIVAAMAGKVVDEIQPWYYRDNYNTSTSQMGGWYINFEHMQWISVKGCGHMVPGYCPYKGYGLFESIIDTGKVGAPPVLFESPTLAPGLIPSNECPNHVNGKKFF